MIETTPKKHYRRVLTRLPLCGRINRGDTCVETIEETDCIACAHGYAQGRHVERPQAVHPFARKKHR